MKKVIIIGGGIAGLSAGVYAQKCGFNSTILESHFIPGGNCTSWKRGDYLFEGGMHWLTGSHPNDPINKLWRHVGALDDSVKINTDEPFSEYDHNGTPVRLYRDVDKTEKHLKELSPADAKEIERFCGYIRKVQKLVMPVSNLKGVKMSNKSKAPMPSLFSILPAILAMGKISKIKRDEYISRFSHEGIREMLRSGTAENSGIMPMVFTMGTLARGDGGFPEGGSLPFARRMANMFTDLGGDLQLSTRADKVIVENGKAVGVMIGDTRMDADAIIVTADTMQIDHLFDTPPKSAWLEKMRETTQPTMCIFVSLGIDADLSKYPHGLYFKAKQPIKIAGETHEYIAINNYATDSTYSPTGKTAVTTFLGGDTYDFWKQAKDEGRYKEEKQKVADEIIAVLAKQIPETEGKVEVIDVATPLTYERYCGNWKGSWMTEMRPGMKMSSYPAVVDNLSCVYFAGQRMMPPGGLPVALMSARIAVQHLCRDTDTVFVSEE